MANASTQTRIDKLKPKVDPKPVVASSITGQLGSTPTKTPVAAPKPTTTVQQPTPVTYAQQTDPAKAKISSI